MINSESVSVAALGLFRFLAGDAFGVWPGVMRRHNSLGASTNASATNGKAAG